MYYCTFLGAFLWPSSATEGPFRCIFVQKRVEISTHSSVSIIEEFQVFICKASSTSDVLLNSLSASEF